MLTLLLVLLRYCKHSFDVSIQCISQLCLLILTVINKVTYTCFTISVGNLSKYPLL